MTIPKERERYFKGGRENLRTGKIWMLNLTLYKQKRERRNEQKDKKIKKKNYRRKILLQ